MLSEIKVDKPETKAKKPEFEVADVKVVTDPDFVYYNEVEDGSAYENWDESYYGNAKERNQRDSRRAKVP